MSLKRSNMCITVLENARNFTFNERRRHVAHEGLAEREREREAGGERGDRKTSVKV